MSKGRKSLTYKDEKYDYETLITLHFDENVKKYFSDIINKINITRS